jgi:hypothetical protein
MARTSTTSLTDRGLLEAALTGLELQRQKIEEQIQTVRSRLGVGGKRRGRPPGPSKAAAKKESGSKRVLSEAARKRIAAAQKKRWAEYRKASGAKGE